MSAATRSEFGLQVFGVFQMGGEGRTYLDEERPEFGVLRVRNQRFVNGTQHRFVIGDFVIHIRLVEGAPGTLL